MKKEINDHSILEGLDVAKISITIPLERAFMRRKK